MRLILVTGMSGAGRTTALKTFEDLGFYCVDNIPAGLLPDLAELVGRRPGAEGMVVAGVDVREGAFLADLDPALRKLKEAGRTSEIIFLEASDEALLRRFTATRRRPPLAQGNDSIEEGLRKERALLEPVRSRANRVVDTTGLSVHDLRSLLVRQYGGADVDQKSLLAVNILSFAYRQGIPPEANFIFDVRFLPNPYWDEKLRDLTGSDRAVYDYVMARPEAKGFTSDVGALISAALPGFAREGRSQLTIAFGCTGGQHRSVVLALWLAGFLREQGYQVRVRHRELPGDAGAG